MSILSIQNLTFALTVGLVLISGGLTGFMSISTEETALDSTVDMYEVGLRDTEKARDDGLTSCFNAGLANSETLAEQLMAKVTDGISAELRRFLQVPQSISNSLLYFMSLQETCFDAQGRRTSWCAFTDLHWRQEVLAPIVWAAFKNGEPLGITEVMTLWLPNDYMNMQFFAVSPLTATGDSRQALGVPDDYRQSFKLEWRQVACNSAMTRTECMSETRKPDFMSQQQWDTTGINGGGVGCRWCVRDPAAPQTLPLADPIFARDGVCVEGNGCLYGFKPDPSFNWVNRPYYTLSTSIDNSGNAMAGECTSLVDSARNSGVPAVTCPVPDVLQSFDFTISRALSMSQHGDAKRVLWSPPTGKGPLVSIQAYGAWTDPLMWDYGDGYGKTVGIVMAAMSTSSISDFMKKVTAPLPKDTVLYAVQQDPWLLPEAPTEYVCTDDPHNFLRASGLQCSVLISIASCDFDIAAFSSRIPRFSYLHLHCPVTCNRCPTDGGHGILLGASHGRSYSELPLNESAYGDQALTDKVPISVVDSEDPIVRTNGRYIMGLNTSLGLAYDALVPGEVHNWWYRPSTTAAVIAVAGGRNLSVPADTGDDMLYWMKLKRLQDEKGLRLTIVLMILRDEAMKTIDVATANTQTVVNADKVKVREDIRKESDSTDDQKQKDFNVMIAVVVAACTVLIIVSIFFVIAIIKPLLALESDMGEVARMKLESVDLDAPPSGMAEVADMQSSFHTMVRNLIEYRNYMPQSILVDDDEEEEEAEEGDQDRVTASRVTTNSSDRDTGGGKRVLSKDSIRQQDSASSFGHREASGSMAHTAHTRKKEKVVIEGLKKKNVTLLTINVWRFHDLMTSDVDAISSNHSAIIAAVLEAVAPATKGVTETFAGDRITSSWNAVKPCGTHKAMAPGVALQLNSKIGELKATVMRKMDADRHPCGMSLVTGETRSGNVGCMGMKKFSVMAPVVTWLYALERYGKQKYTAITVDKWLNRETADNFLYQTVGLADFPKRSPQPISVHALCGKKTVGEDEWMYQLEQGEKNDPNAAWNKYALAVMSDDWSTATELQAKATEGESLPSAVVVGDFSAAVEQSQQQRITTRIMHH